MVPAEVCGMVSITLSGCLCVAINATISEAGSLGLPFFYLYGSGSVLAGLVLALVCAARGAFARMDASCWKWAALRGVGGTSAMTSQLVAIALGAPVGDTSALSCINVVLSALLGRAFLGEPLRALHILALMLSFSGAVMISQPEFLFGDGGGRGAAPLAGYAMALASGVFSGCTFIAARRAQDVDAVVLTASVTTLEGLACFVMPQVGLVSGPPALSMLESPTLTAVSIPLVGLLCLAACGLLSLGSQLCPAAASSTLFSASSMTLGYMLQTVLHAEAPKAATVSGAALMLLSVAMMAAQTCFNTSRFPEADEADGMAAPLLDDDGSSEATSSHSSLAHFVASEWSGVAGSPAISRLADSAREPAQAVSRCAPASPRERDGSRSARSGRLAYGGQSFD